MTLLVETGTFAKETTNVDGADQEVNLTGAFQPKALWLWTNGNTGNGSYAEHFTFSYGFSDGTNDACIAAASEDNAGTSDAGGAMMNDSAVCILSTTAPDTTIDAKADVLSFDIDGFTLNWAISSADANVIHYLAIGGTDITNVIVVNRTIGTTGTGNVDFTDVGFQGDFVNVLCENRITANTAGAGFEPLIGAATSSSARWMWSGLSEDSVPNTDTYTAKEIAQFMGLYNGATGDVLALADFVSFLSNGFRINISDAWASATRLIAYIVVKGGLWDVGSGTAPATATTQDVSITAGRDPEAVMIMSWGDTTTSSGATGEAENRMGIGCSDGTNENCTSGHDTDAVGTSVITQISKTDKVLHVHTANATAGSSTTLAECDMQDMASSGKFTLSWTTTLNAMGFVWFAVSKTFVGAAVTDEEIRRGVSTSLPTICFEPPCVLVSPSAGRSSIRTF